MSDKRFDFGVDIPTKITKYTKRFIDLEGFLDEDYDGEHHMLWDNQDECWIFLDEVLCLMEKEYANIKEENEKLKSERRNDVKELFELFKQNLGLKRRLDYEKRMHKQWKDDCLAILEEQDLNDYVKELQKSKKSGWDSEPNTDYITRVKEGLK